MPLVSAKALRRDRILQAAGRLFAHQGYHGTGTRQIAHLASVSELTLFRHFNDKESLFWATLDSHFAALDLQKDLFDKVARQESAEVALPGILELFADTASYRPDLLRLIAVALVEMHPKGAVYIEERLSPAFMAIRQYVGGKIHAGRMRDLDCTTVTAALTMTALTHAEFSRMLDKSRPLFNRQERSRALSRFWLELLAPAESGHAQLPAAVKAEEHPC